MVVANCNNWFFVLVYNVHCFIDSSSNMRNKIHSHCDNMDEITIMSTII